MSMIPIPQETFRSAREPQTSAPRNTFEAGYPAKRWTPPAIVITSLILLTSFALWGGIWVAFAAAVGWL